MSASPAIIQNQTQNGIILVPIYSGYNPNIETGYNPNQQIPYYSIVAPPDNQQGIQPTELPSYKQAHTFGTYA